jgi:hypothetical protein
LKRRGNPEGFEVFCFEALPFYLAGLLRRYTPRNDEISEIFFSPLIRF